MSFIEASRDHRYPWHVRLVLGVLARRGRLSRSVLLWARAPRPFLAFLRLYRAVDRAGSPLPPALRSLVMARVSQVNRCAFCVDLNRARALARGVTPEQLDALADHETSPLFDPRERAALRFADAVSAAGAEIDPELRRALRAAFPDDAVVELAALVAFQNLSAKFNHALDVPEEGYCAIGRPAAPAAREG